MEPAEEQVVGEEEETKDQVEECRVRLKVLIRKKDAIEEEINAIHEVLNSPGEDGTQPVGLQGNLVDADGFPRNDIDVMNIRTLRNRFFTLQNDHMSTMKNIEKGLVVLHSFSNE